MEPLSAAASVVGVVGLLIQLAEAINNIYKFIIAAEDAPADIQAMIDEVENLKAIFAGIAEDEQLYAMAACLIGAAPDTKVLNNLLQTCTQRVSEFSVILTELDRDCKSSNSLNRKWKMVKAAFRGTEAIKKFSDSLTRLKLTLMLGQQWSMRKTMQRLMEMEQSQHQNLRHIMEMQSKTLVISQRIEKLMLEQPGNAIMTASKKPAILDDDARSNPKSYFEAPPYSPIYRQPQTKPSQRDGWLIQCNHSLFCARLQYKVAWTNEGDENQNTQKIGQRRSQFTRKEYQFIYRPKSWLQLLGLKYGYNIALSLAQRGWQYKFNTFNSVPTEASIFRLSRAGDVAGVQALLSSKEASIWDVDDRGNTPLHYAAASCHIDLCQMLFHAGADTQARNYDTFYVHNKTPLTMVCEGSGCSGCKINLIRLFSHAVDFWDEESVGWDVITCLLYAADKRNNPCGDSTPLKWVLSGYGTDIRLSPVRNVELRKAVRTSNDPVSTGLILQAHEDVVTESFSLKDGAYNLLHDKLDEFCYDPIDRLEILKLLSNLGVDLHLPTNANVYHGLIPQSPTSFAMRYSHLFSIWKKLLCHLNLDFESFIQAEFKANSVLKDAGWTQETLLRLFEVEYEPRYLGMRSEAPVCTTCGCWGSIDPEELWWLWLQETIRAPRGSPTQSKQPRPDYHTHIWNRRYQWLDPIPRTSIYSDHDLVEDCPWCIFETSRVPSNNDNYNVGDNETEVEKDKQKKKKQEEFEQGICLGWPSLCKQCEREAERKQADLERKRREEGYDCSDEDGYGDSMFLLSLDKFFVKDSTPASGG